MPAPRKNAAIVFYWKLHRSLYRATRGRIGSMGAPGRTLLLTTTGRKSGKPRHVTLTYLEDQSRLVVVATNLGQDHDPAWWRNLQADPRATVLRDSSTLEVVAHRLEGADADRVYRRFVDEVDPGYAEYRTRTRRAIPVVALVPA